MDSVNKRRRRRPLPTIAYIDTEFNAFDYYGQNGGNQEIIQIGLVVMKGGKQLDGFKSYCALKKGHVLSKRSTKLTGIKMEHLKDAPEYKDVVASLNAFLDQYNPDAIYAYGCEDRQQMLNTARLYNIKGEELYYIDKIEDNMKKLGQLLGLKKRSNLSLSVKDLCSICAIDCDNAHDAFSDALYLAECSERIRRGAFAEGKVEELLERKSWMSNYRMSRRIKDCREGVILDDEDLLPFKALIDTLKEDGTYPDYQLQAIYDDLLMITGRLPESGV